MNGKNAIETEHKLDFVSRRWGIGEIYQEFQVGTCKGLWFCTRSFYGILAIINECPGNGHLNDVFQWFENSARRDHKTLLIIEFTNERFRHHCITKRGFETMPGTTNLYKTLSK
jgi:hypothetical protein